MRYFNCYECLSTVYFSNADMVGNILVSYGMPVENVSSSLLLVELYCVIEGNAYDGTAENTVFKVGISYLVFVSCVNPRELICIQAFVKHTVKSMVIHFTVLQRGQFTVSVNGTSVKSHYS